MVGFFGVGNGATAEKNAADIGFGLVAFEGEFFRELIGKKSLIAIVA